MQNKITLSLNSKILDKFRNYCEENDVMLSKRIERLIKEHLEEQKKRGGK